MTRMSRTSIARELRTAVVEIEAEIEEETGADEAVTVVDAADVQAEAEVEDGVDAAAVDVTVAVAMADTVVAAADTNLSLRGCTRVFADREFVRGCGVHAAASFVVRSINLKKWRG